MSKYFLRTAILLLIFHVNLLPMELKKTQEKVVVFPYVDANAEKKQLKKEQELARFHTKKFRHYSEGNIKSWKEYKNTMAN